MQYQFEDQSPEVHPDAFVCDEATVIGNVVIKENAGIWPGVVLRGDLGQVRVGKHTHVEDGTVVHMSEIGERVMIGHNATIDAASVGDDTLVSNNATLNYQSNVGECCIVAAGAVLPEGREVPPESFVHGVPAEITPFEDASIDAEEILGFYNAEEYTRLARKHKNIF